MHFTIILSDKSYFLGAGLDVSYISLKLVQTNSNRARLSWTFSHIYCIFVHPDFDSAPLFVGMRASSVGYLFQMEHV